MFASVISYIPPLLLFAPAPPKGGLIPFIQSI
jgi:hypothetical protein